MRVIFTLAYSVSNPTGSDGGLESGGDIALE
jgi:hypothetical protein